MAKINVSLPDGVLGMLDEAARESRTTRSGLLAWAVKHYLKTKEEEQLRERRRQAASSIHKVAEEIGPWDGTTEVLKWR